jgi:peptidoglycan/LPS O-acetylase OafA/YrhL
VREKFGSDIAGMAMRKWLVRLIVCIGHQQAFYHHPDWRPACAWLIVPPMDSHARGHVFYQEGLTGLRALAACWVTLFHVNAFAGPRVISIHPFGFRIDLHPLMTVGWLGVTIFFVLSGFLLTMHLMNTLERREEGTLRRYFAARIRRVIPAYWAQLAILLIVAYVAAGRAPDWTQYVPLHLLMLHNVSEKASFAINSVYWTLPIEFAFYFILPLIATRLAAREDWAAPRFYRLLALLYAASLAIAIGYRYAAFRLAGASPVWISNQLPGAIDVFMLGTVIAVGLRRWRKDGRPVARWLPDALTLVGLSGILVLIYYLDAIYATFFTGHHAVYWWYSANGLFAGVLVLGVALGGAVSRVLFANVVAVAIGTISYSLYLWHFPVVEWLGAAKLGYGEFFAAAIPLSLVASALSYWLVERPFLRPARAPTAGS